MFPTVVTLNYDQQSIITCQIGVLEGTHSGDMALEVLYLLCWILGCPLTSVMSTMISFCLKFPPSATTLNFLLTSHRSKSGWVTRLGCATSCLPSSGSTMGVQDEGSQAGDEEITESGIGVTLPGSCELGFQSGLERWGLWCWSIDSIVVSCSLEWDL